MITFIYWMYCDVLGFKNYRILPFLEIDSYVLS